MVCIHSHYPPRGLFQSLSFPLFLLSKLTSFLKWKKTWIIVFHMIETLCMDFVETNIWFERISLDINLHIASVFLNWKIILKTSKFWEKKPIRLHCPMSIVFWVGNMLPEIKMISASLNFCNLIHTLVHIVFILEYPSRTPWNSSFLSLQQSPMVKITLEVQACDQVTFHYRWKNLVLDGYVAIYVGEEM